MSGSDKEPVAVVFVITQQEGVKEADEDSACSRSAQEPDPAVAIGAGSRASLRGGMNIGIKERPIHER